MPSIFKGEQGIPRDDEAHAIWSRLVPADRILEYGLDDNFWQMGDTGPCGRCSEIYYAREPGRPDVEIWNNVFMEFERSADGTLTPLPAPSIDTGMGLERVTAVLQHKQSNYDTDLFTPILGRIGELTGVQYGAGQATDVSMRVVADHIRATTFLIADGVIPSNEWRGYVLRKIMRRAMRHGKHLGMTEPFLHKLLGVLVQQMGDAYPELPANRFAIETAILAEEVRFEAVLIEGLPRLEAEIAKVVGTKSKILSGEVAFKLYDTFGVPYDFIEDTAATQGVTIDREAYERAMEGQRGKARAGSTFGGTRKDETFALGEGDPLSGLADRFEGYANTRLAGVPVVALFDDKRQPIERLETGQTGYVALAGTPFYLEAGGQVSDSGRIFSETGDASATVEGLVRVRPGVPRAHRVHVTSGSMHVRDIVTAEVDAGLRDATRRNHTATHLLHAALRQVLGSHVKQAGSLVAPDRLRFDFVHFQQVTRDELDRIERIVNEQIYRNAPVTTEIRSTQEAIASGATALFGEKYGDQVRVVSVPGFSMELCGGTHVGATGDIGFFVITAESGVAAGVRRIEANTGAGAVQWAQHQRATMDSVLTTLGVSADQAAGVISRLQGESKRTARENTKLKTEMALAGLRSALDSQSRPRSALDDTEDVGGVKLARRRVSGLDKDALRGLADSLKDKIGSGVVVIASESDGKVQIVVAVTRDLTGRVKAGQIVKEIAPIVGGGGGGRPDFAEAGGKRPEKIDEMLEESRRVLEAILASPRP